MIRKLDATVLTACKRRLRWIPGERQEYAPRLFSPSFASTSPGPKHASPYDPDLHSLNKRISRLIRLGRVTEARDLFDGADRRDTVTWNSMMTGYVKRREIAKARKLFDEMPQQDVVSWNLMISGYLLCKGKRSLEEGRKLFNRMPARDSVSYNTMISGYAKNGRMDEALTLFDEMHERDVVSWNAMVTGFLENGDVHRGVDFFLRMPKWDSASLCALVSGLVLNGMFDEAGRVLVECENKDNGELDLVPAYNTLLAAYGHGGWVNEARKLFERIPCGNGGGRGRNGRFERNVVSWNTMIMCYVKLGDVLSARELFDQMVERDSFSWNTMISGHVHNLDMGEASKLFSQMPNPDTHTWNLMILGHAQLGNLELAQEFFERMPQKNYVSWNTMIAGYEKNLDFNRAVRLFIRMQDEGERPDRHTLSSLLSVSSDLVDLHLGMQLHQMVTKIVIPDVPINNALITMYSKCGAITEAHIIFDVIKLKKDVITWNAMIGGYASHGYALEALELLKLMKSFQVQPTYITFISVLHACAHAGLKEEGRGIFKSMISEYGIEPRLEHFASLVDILCRQGELEEALELINGMPYEAGKAVWGALLSASAAHNNIEMAQVAAESLMRIEPESSAPYVSLYNLYANLGLWDEATELRMMMEKNNIWKQAAYSSVDSSL